MVASRGSSALHGGISGLSEGRVRLQLPGRPLSQALKQTELLPASLGPREMIGGQFRPPLVETELVAGDLEAAPDHPGHRPGALHPGSPLRIVVAPAAHV